MNLSYLLKTNKTPIAPTTREVARVYVRVSHERSAEKAISPETQRRLIEEYADRKAYKIKEWYTELAKSAFRDDDLRTEFKRMIADAKADPETTVILVYRYDRFSRGNTASAIQGELLRYGVRIESVEEGYYDPDSETGAIMMPLTWSFNRLFSIKLRNVVVPNMKTNFEQRDKATGWAFKNGGWAQWGYKTQRINMGKDARGDIHKQIWVLDDREIAGKPVWLWAREMLLEWRLKEHLGYDRIADRLTEYGVPTPSGKPAWSMSTIQSLIGDISRLYQYAGYAFWNREDCSNRNAHKRRDPSEWIIVENAHPAIVSEAECEAVWNMVKDRAKPTKSGREGEASRFALSGGRLKCKICGANYAGIKRKAGDYYVCGSHLYRRGSGCGPAWNIPRIELETTLLRRALKYMTMDADTQAKWIQKANDENMAEWQEFERTAPDRRKRIKELEKNAKNLADAIAQSGPLPELMEALNLNNGHINRLKGLQSSGKPPLLSADAIENYRNKLQAAISDVESDARRIILQELVTEVIVDPEKRIIEGQMADPRSIVYIYMAAPRGVEPLSRP